MIACLYDLCIRYSSACLLCLALLTRYIDHWISGILYSTSSSWRYSNVPMWLSFVIHFEDAFTLIINKEWMHMLTLLYVSRVNMKTAWLHSLHFYKQSILTDCIYKWVTRVQCILTNCTQIRELPHWKVIWWYSVYSYTLEEFGVWTHLSLPTLTNKINGRAIKQKWNPLYFISFISI